MFSKNFIVIIPDSNGDQQVLPLEVSHATGAALDESTVLELCNVGIERYINSDEPIERDDAIMDVLRENGYEVWITMSTYSVITTR